MPQRPLPAGRRCGMVARPRRRSSGVEHSLGKGGVGSSILPGGTTLFQALSRNPWTSESGDDCANAQKPPSSVRGTSPPERLELPLAVAPATVRGHGLRAALPFPLVSPGKRPGYPYTTFRTTPERAWNFPELEYGNAGSSVAALVLDCDNPADLRRGLPDLPAPHWVVSRSANDHAHVCWSGARVGMDHEMEGIDATEAVLAGGDCTKLRQVDVMTPEGKSIAAERAAAGPRLPPAGAQAVACAPAAGARGGSVAYILRLLRLVQAVEDRRGRDRDTGVDPAPLDGDPDGAREVRRPG